jgi:hypothetical protein
MAGCTGGQTVEPPTDETGEEVGDEGEEAEEPKVERELVKGGDPGEDVAFSEKVNTPSSTKWTSAGHPFRLPLKLGSAFDVGDEVRLTIDVGTALQEAGLDWIGPGIKLAQINADPRSVVLHSISGSGQIQSMPSIEARQAEKHSLEIAFEHVGGEYVLFFADVEDHIDSGANATFDDAVHATGFRGSPEWQGADFWGITANSGVIKYWPGDKVIMYATIHSNAREAGKGSVPIDFTIDATAPDDWDDVETDPKGAASATHQRRVSLSGITPEDASGSDTVFLDVHSGGDTVTISLLVKYHDT